MKNWQLNLSQKLKRNVIGGGLAVTVMLGNSLGRAAETESSVQEMTDLVVTVSRKGESAAEISSNVTVIDSDYIELSPATDLGDLLAEAGVGHIHKYPGTLTSIGLRGFRTDSHGNDLDSHVLILINGRRAGTGNVAKILTDNIERGEILRGGGIGAVWFGCRRRRRQRHYQKR